MADLELLGLLDGLTATIIVAFGFIAAPIMYYRAYKMNAKFLQLGAIMSVFAVLLWLGPTIDFLTILLTQNNLVNTEGLYGLLSYMWVPPALVTGLYLGSLILAPKIKKIVLIIYSIIGIIFELLLFLDTKNAFIFTQPPAFESGTLLIDSRFNSSHPIFYLIAFFLISLIALNGVGSIRQAVKSPGIIRKKSIALATVFLLFPVVAIIDAYIKAGYILFISRSGMIVIAIFMYLALKP